MHELHCKPLQLVRGVAEIENDHVNCFGWLQCLLADALALADQRRRVHREQLATILPDLVRHMAVAANLAWGGDVQYVKRTKYEY